MPINFVDSEFPETTPLQQTAPRIPRWPRGCDEQGRHPEAAECCTDLGADDCQATVPQVLEFWGIVFAAVGVLSLVLLGLAW